jgi:hypothetical protein
MSLALRPSAAAALSGKEWLAVGIAIAPFIAKRIFLLTQPDYGVWLAADYGARAVSIFGFVLARQIGLSDRARPTAGLLKSIFVFLYY